ncbi:MULTISPECIES: DUF397 domain-containing protein [Streptomyces]|uniref:DUF397 domain-containing protein n=1 Tax=Streptomyces TaxID=1883 RepID=UPI00345C1B7F
MNKFDRSRAIWRKSSYSNAQSSCVEISESFPGAVLIRDSKVSHGPVLLMPSSAWSSFVNGVRRGIA